MEHIKVAKVESVGFTECSYPAPVNASKDQATGTLHLTPHHLIFEHEGGESWLPFPLFQSCTLHPINALTLSPLVIRTRDFKAFTFFFKDYVAATQVWESCKAIVTNASIQSTYAFCTPSTSQASEVDAWSIYNPVKEFARMSAIPDHPDRPTRSNAWRWSSVNAGYDFCSTYPAQLAVPAKISDVTLKYGKPYRSKHRIPALVYLHWANLGSITRASQPMAGLLNNARSIQDEKLIEAIFHSHTYHTTSKHVAPAEGAPLVYGARAANLIIDARPTTNARANAVKGAGSENMDYYKDCNKEYLGIDNIHVMRDALRAVNDVLIASEATGSVDKNALRKSGWLKHLSLILDGALIIVKNVHVANSHVLIHCSDGWDRTAQLSALSQLCLDPYYRTIEGFIVLIEKDFVSFGHKFNQRTGHTVADRTAFVAVPGSEVSSHAAFLSNVQKGLALSSAHFKETSPVFQQFLDCVYQLVRQFPKRFQFDQRLLQSILYHLYSCRFGNFLFDSEQDRVLGRRDTPSVWSLYLANEATKATWLNPSYDASLDDATNRQTDQGVLICDPKDVAYWHELFGRQAEELNDTETDRLAAAMADAELVERIERGPSSMDDVQEGRVDDVASSKRNHLALAVDTVPRATSPSYAGSPTKAAQSPFLDPANQVRLQSAAQSVWKFGNSSWKAVKSGVTQAATQAAQRVQAADTPFTAGVQELSNGSPLDRPYRSESQRAGLQGLDVNPWREVPKSDPPARLASATTTTPASKPAPAPASTLAQELQTAKPVPEPHNWGNSDPLGVS